MADTSTLNLDSKTQEIAFDTNISHTVVFFAAIFSILWGLVNAMLVKSIDMDNVAPVQKALDEAEKLKQENGDNEAGEDSEDPDMPKDAIGIRDRIRYIGDTITEGAISFLKVEYLVLSLFCVVFAIVLALTVDWQEMSPAAGEVATNAPYTSIAFFVGALTSILAGYIGMRIAVFTNTRTTFLCCDSTHRGFFAAFQGGQVLGFTLVGLALLVLEIIILVFKQAWFDGALAETMKQAKKDNLSASATDKKVMDLTRRLFELIAGYGLGGSTVALFGRVGGGIYTKAADVGADLVGKVLKDLKEDDPSNPGTIADNVGDNVGDIAGMGADLFGSLAESTCAALVVSSTSRELIYHTDALYFPLLITSMGIFASFLSVLLGYIGTVTEKSVQLHLKLQLLFSTVLMTGTLIPIVYILPETFNFGDLVVGRWTAYGCVIIGLWSGMVIGFSTEYYTSNAYGPTLSLAQSCTKGPAPNIILGLALGYNSCIIPIICLTATIGYAFTYSGMYGIGLSALGMLGSLPVALTIDGYGPISDNAGGIAEMSGLPAAIRSQTDALDAAGNTTAAIGKGFAIGSACLVGLALFGAFNTRVGTTSVDILQPIQFCGLMVGAMLPYAFSALTMKAVGDAASQMMDFIIEDFDRVQQIKRRNQENPDNKESELPNYQKCIEISTSASLKYMILPGILVISSPLIAGFTFGPAAVSGLLAGIIVSGIQVAISASNTGGAWDNCKKEIEKERADFALSCAKQGHNFKKLCKQTPSDELATMDTAEGLDLLILQAKHYKDKKDSAVVGDTVGDPLKDTSGPAINILIKLSAITSLVFGNYIKNNHIWGKK